MSQPKVTVDLADLTAAVRVLEAERNVDLSWSEREAVQRLRAALDAVTVPAAPADEPVTDVAWRPGRRRPWKERWS